MSHKDVGSRRLDLQTALGATLRVLPRLWRAAAGSLLICAAAWLVPVLVPMPGWAATAVSVAAGVATVMAVGAMARLSVTDDLNAARALGLGPWGLQIGWPEVRLVGSALLCLIFLAMIVIVLALVVLAVAGTAELDAAAIQARDWGRVGSLWKLGLLAVLAVGSVLIVLLLVVRLSLFIPATLGRRQMVSLNSMGIAYGSVWALLSGLIVTGLPAIALWALAAAGPMPGWTGPTIGVVGLVWLQLPLSLAFLGAAYRKLEYWSPGESMP